MSGEFLTLALASAASTGFVMVVAPEMPWLKTCLAIALLQFTIRMFIAYTRLRYG